MFENMNLPRILSLVVGVVFILVGIAGFIPGLTTNLGDMTFAGHESEAQLLGLFHVSVLHNLVHLAFGIAAVAMATTTGLALAYLFVGGVSYLVLAVYGFVIDHGTAANFVPIDAEGNWLHLGLGVGMIALGIVGYLSLNEAAREVAQRQLRLPGLAESSRR